MRRLPAIFVLLMLTLIPEAGQARHATSFFAVVVSDADASAAWYARTFGVAEIKRSAAPAYDVRIMRDDRFLVEIIQLKPEAPKPPEDHLGYSKVGIMVDDFDGDLARWKGDGVKFYGGGAPRVFFDKLLGLHNTLLLDPDGNLVQIFGLSASAPRD